MVFGGLGALGQFYQANQAYQTGEANLQEIQENIKDRQQTRQVNDLKLQAMQQQQQRQQREQQQMQQLAIAKQQQEAAAKQQKANEISEYQSKNFGVNPNIKQHLDYLQSQEDIARANLDFSGADSIRKQIDTARRDDESARAAADKDKVVTQDRMANVLLDAKDPQRMAAAIKTIGDEAVSTGNPYYKNLYERLSKLNIADPKSIMQVQQMGLMMADSATKGNLAKAQTDAARIRVEEMRDARMERVAQIAGGAKTEAAKITAAAKGGVGGSDIFNQQLAAMPKGVFVGADGKEYTPRDEVEKNLIPNMRDTPYVKPAGMQEGRINASIAALSEVKQTANAIKAFGDRGAALGVFAAVKGDSVLSALTSYSTLASTGEANVQYKNMMASADKFIAVAERMGYAPTKAQMESIDQAIHAKEGESDMARLQHAGIMNQIVTAAMEATAAGSKGLAPAQRQIVLDSYRALKSALPFNETKVFEYQKYAKNKGTEPTIAGFQSYLEKEQEKDAKPLPKGADMAPGMYESNGVTIKVYPSGKYREVF